MNTHGWQAEPPAAQDDTPYSRNAAAMLAINRYADELRRQLSLGAQINYCQCGCGALRVMR